MGRVVSIHEYELRPGIDGAALERVMAEAEVRGLFGLPGLVDHYFLRGIKGPRRERYVAVWVFESRAAWEALWGPVEDPKTKEDYPDEWKVWEEELLAPLLTVDPDTIRFTSYAEVETGRVQS